MEIYSSVLKGSVESLSDNSEMSESTFLNPGTKTCKLSSDQRRFVYQVYERCREYLSDKNLWDRL